MSARQTKPFFLLPLMAITMFVGCSTPVGDWVKDSTQPLQVDQDKYACLQQAQQPFSYLSGPPGWGPGWGGGTSGYAGVQTNQELYRACMKARGYSWQPGLKPN